LYERLFGPKLDTRNRLQEMITTRNPMAPRGRPRKTEEEKKKTGTLRVKRDIAEMIVWISRIRKVDTATLLDPIIRASITGRYAELLPAIKIIKAAEDDARREQGLPPTDPLPVVAVLTGKESLEEIARIINEADAAHAASHGENDDEDEPVEKKHPKPKRRR
jgi:hypothetical protein